MQELPVLVKYTNRDSVIREDTSDRPWPLLTNLEYLFLLWESRRPTSSSRLENSSEARRRTLAM